MSKQPTPEQIEASREKKKALAEISKKAKPLAQANGLTLNQYLVEYVYKNEIHQEFKTFNDWRKEGKRVKKGEKAFTLWSRPVNATAKANANESNKSVDTNQTEAEREFQFFNLCYVFSNAQVENITPDNNQSIQTSE